MIITVDTDFEGTGKNRLEMLQLLNQIVSSRQQFFGIVFGFRR